MSSVSPDSRTHVFLFPFPSAGHVIPLLDLAHLLLAKDVTITILITPPNLPLLQPLISTHPSDSIRPLVLSLPQSVQSYATNLVARIRATAQLRDPVSEWFRSQASPPVAIISDFFVGWTHHLAAELGVPRLVFWPSGAKDTLILHHLWENLSDDFGSLDQDSLVAIPTLPDSAVFPLWQVSELLTLTKKGEPDWEFYRDNFLSNSKSWGLIFNSFKDLEGVFVDRLKMVLSNDKVWAVGPLVVSSAREKSASSGPDAVPLDLLTWLDDKADDSVVYVCFGSRVTLTCQQVDALAAALDRSGVHFVWCTKEEVSEEYENRVAVKGLIIRGWAPQVAILNHRAVGAFLTHCGWNSVLEGVAAGVVLLTWPIGSDQFSNSRLIVDELGLGIEACSGGPKTIPDSTELGGILAGSVSRDEPKRARASEMRDAAWRAVQDGGSSSRDLDELVKRLKELEDEKRK